MVTKKSNKKLVSSREELFCQNMVAGMSRKDSYVAAGYNPKNGNSASIGACKLMKKPEVVERIKTLQNQVTRRVVKGIIQKKVADIDERREILTEILRGTFGLFVDETGEIKLDPENLSNHALGEISRSSFKGGKDGRAAQEQVKIKLRDPMAAIDLLNKMDKLYQAETGGNTTFNDNRQIKIIVVEDGNIDKNKIIGQAIDNDNGD